MIASLLLQMPRASGVWPCAAEGRRRRHHAARGPTGYSTPAKAVQSVSTMRKHKPQSTAPPAVGSPVVRPNLSNLCRKTKLCALFSQGACDRWDCAFAHGVRELRALPDLQRTRLCPYLLAHGQCLAAAAYCCKFAHSDEEIFRYCLETGDEGKLGRPGGEFEDAGWLEEPFSVFVGGAGAGGAGDSSSSTCAELSTEEGESEGSSSHCSPPTPMPDSLGGGPQLEFSIKNTFLDLCAQPRHSSQRSHSVPCSLYRCH